MRPSPTDSSSGDFDERFERHAKSLAEGRPSYPAQLYQQILAAAGCRTFEVAVDVGCGAGHSLSGLFAIANEVRGVEPGVRLRELAERLHPEAIVSAGTGEETGLAAESIDLVAIGTAFTWMDSKRTLSEAHRVLRRGGILAIYAYGFPRLRGSADEVVRRHLREHWDAHRSSLLRDPIDVGACARESGLFRSCDSFVVPNWIDYEPARLARFFASASFVNAFMETQEDPQSYLAQLERELRVAAGDRLEVDFSLATTVAQKSE